MESPLSSRMSERLQASRHSTVSLTALLRTALWAVCHFLFYFAQQVAELIAPFALILGIGWAILPKLVGSITAGAAAADPQARELMNHLSGTIPTSVTIGSHTLTPDSLIFDGFLLMALAAVGATISALAAREM